MPLRVSPAFALLLFLVLYSMRAAALEPENVLVFKTGPLSIRPQVAATEQYNDNIFYQANDELEDFITIISPGLKLQLGRPAHNYVLLDYRMDQLFYASNDELNTAQHTLDLRNKFAWEKLRLEGSDRVQLLSSPLGGVTERVVDTNGVVVLVPGNIDRTSWDDDYTLSYDLGEKTGVYVRATHNFVDYQGGTGLYDLETLRGTGGFSYRAFAKTAFFGEVHYGQTRTEPNLSSQLENPRLEFVGGYLGARGNFTPKLSGTIKVGYESRSFQDGSEAPSDPVVELSLAHVFTEKRMLSLNYSRLNAVSVQYSRQTYTADTVALQLVQLFGPSRKWRAMAGLGYYHYQYEEGQGNLRATQYDYLRGTLNLAYQIQRWLTASCGYDFEQVSGDTTAVIDYTVNRVTLRLAIGY